jgi:hypothetical protein
MAVGAREHLPVHETNVIARRVFAVIGELDSRAAIVRLVRAGEGAFGGAARTQADVPQRFHGGEVEVTVLEGVHGHGRSDDKARPSRT